MLSWEVIGQNSQTHGFPNTHILCGMHRYSVEHLLVDWHYSLPRLPLYHYMLSWEVIGQNSQTHGFPIPIILCGMQR